MDEKEKRDHYNKRRREARAANPERYRAVQRAYRANNRERVLEIGKKSYQKNIAVSYTHLTLPTNREV